MMVCLGVSGTSIAQCNDRPIINDFSPKTGFIGSTVTITGANFDATPANNQVFFGATQATIVASSFGTLEVRVPEGSTTALISVKNNCNLTAYSKTHFNGIFCPTPLTATSYQNTSQELTGIYGAYNMLSQDMDNDGKPEVISAANGGGITIATNNSTPGTINFGRYNNGSTGGAAQSIAVADFDGDGLKDIVTNSAIMRNTSTGVGNVGLLYVTDSRLVSNYQVGAGDFNNDGKIDIIGENGNTVWIAFNTSTGPGNFNFTARQVVQNVGSRCTGIQVADIDGDGKTDFIASQGGANRAVSIRNTTANGSLTASFESPEYWSSDPTGAGTFPYRAMIADFDKDGRIDFTSCNYTGATNTAIWRNTSTVGNISFATTVNIPSPVNNYRIGVGDVDGDGYPDIVTKSLGVNVFSVYRNTTSSAGTPSFAARFDYSSSNRAEVSGIVIGDLDGDFVPDIATSGISSNTIRFHRNTGAQNDVTPPTVSCRNIIVALSPAGTVTITTEMIDNGSGDACGIESLVLSETTFTCANIGENTVTLTATDGAGNQSTCTAIVNVQPAAIIVAGQSTVCQGETVEMNANDGDSYQWKKDGAVITNATNQNYIATATGNYTVIVTNAGGCSGESIATPVVVNENPTVDISPSGNAFLCPPNGSSTLTATESSIYQWMKDGVDIPNATQQSYEATTVGNYSVRVIDLFGCSAISDATIITANPAELEVSGNGDYGNALPNQDYTKTITISNTGSGNLDITNLQVSGNDASAFALSGFAAPGFIAPGNSATIEVIFNAPNITSYAAFLSFNSNDCNQGFVSLPLTAEITCEKAAITSTLNNLDVFTDAGLCTALINYEVISEGNPTPTLTYILTGATIGSGSGTGSGLIYNSGTTTISVTTENACGIETKDFVLTVIDNQAPTVFAQNLTIELDSAGNASITPEAINNGSFDNCAISSITVSPNQFTCADYGDNEVTLTVNDIYGNSNSAQATVTVTDGSSQTTFNQADYVNIGNSSYLGNSTYKLTSAVNGQFGGVWYQNKLNLSSDFELDFDIYLGNKDFGADGMAFVLQPLSTNQGSSGGGLGYLGINPSLAVEFDTYRNTSDPYQDHVALTKNGDTNHSTSNNLSGPHVVSNLENGAYHNVKISWKKDTNSFKVVFQGNTIINYTGDIINTIFSGNSGVFWGFTAATGGLNNEHRVKINTVDFIEEVTVSEESITPATCSDSLNGAIEINISSNSPCITYSWSNGETTQDIANLNPGDYTVTVSKPGGTNITQTFTVPGDTLAPNVITQNIVVDLDASGNISISPEMINNGSTDACGIQSLALNINTFSCANVGVNEVLLTATDVNGNVASQTAIVTVNDVTAPIVVTNDISLDLDANGYVTITPEMINNGSSDACGIKTLSLNAESFSCSNVGVNEVILTVEDVNGNKASLTANVTVNDVTNPTVITQAVAVTLANGEATISTQDVDGGTFDNCTFALALDNDRFTCNDIGENLVTLTATDASGNTAAMSAIVTVIGDIPTVSINDFYAVNTQKVNTIFLGFAETVNLSTVVSGGTGFTYQWTTSSGELVSNEANPSIMPEVSTYYNVTVTNSNGCSASTSLYVCVIDARGFDRKGRPNGKVVVCHHTSGKKGTKHVEIVISKNAVMKHLTLHGVDTDHADSLGACTATCVGGGANAKGDTKSSVATVPSLNDNLSIYPNPSNGIFDIRLTAVSLDTNIFLFDTTGKLIERKFISKEESSDNIVTIGNFNLSSGLYILKIITKNETVSKKLIITKD